MKIHQSTIPSSTPHKSMRGAPGPIGLDGVCSLVALPHAPSSCGYSIFCQSRPSSFQSHLVK